jgi:hypothetical protein
VAGRELVGPGVVYGGALVGPPTGGVVAGWELVGSPGGVVSGRELVGSPTGGVVAGCELVGSPFTGCGVPPSLAAAIAVPVIAPPTTTRPATAKPMCIFRPRTCPPTTGDAACCRVLRR